MVGFLLAWDIKHKHVASGPSTQNRYPGKVERLGEFGVWENLKIGEEQVGDY